MDFFPTVSCEDDAFRLLKIVTSKSQCHMTIPAGVKLTMPVTVTWVCDQEATTQLLITAEKGSAVTITEELSGSTPTWTHVAAVTLAEGAEIDFVSAQRVGTSTALTMKQKSHVGDNARIHWRNVSLGAKELTHELISNVAGIHGHSAIDWLFYAKSDERYALNAKNVFAARHGEGEIVMKGVAEGRGYVECDGAIHIGPDGGQTDSYLTQEVLMLDPTARVDAVPGLEIKTNDVKASHSATVTRVSEEDLFYFASRGVAEHAARKMFVEGFLADRLEQVSDDRMREELLRAIDEKYALTA